MLVDKSLKTDLTKSGIHTSLIKQLGLYVLKGEALRKELRYKESTRMPPGLKAYAIPYFDENGKDTGFRRYRMLSRDTSWYEFYPDRAKFGKGTKELRAAKSYKYNQPAGTEPHLYIPPNIGWHASPKIHVPHLLITEGEKKAIKAAACGIHCVAIPGVWNFKSKKRRMSLLPEFRKFDFTDTVVEVCFDTDAEFNENIRDALFTITGELEQRTHKTIRHVKLPSTGEREALDDFLLQFKSPRQARDAFFELPREGDEDKEDALAVLNRDVVFVDSQSKFYSVPSNTYFSRNALMDKYEKLPKLIDPENPNRRIKAPALWLATRGPETDVADVVYAPGRDERFSHASERFVNRWRPGSLKPNKESAKPWLDLVDHVFENATKEEKQWFLQWLAYPIQNIGAKLNQGVFLYSAMHGVGKNFIFEPFVKQIYGRDWNNIGGDALGSKFNSWIADKRFVLIDEFYRSSRWDRNQISSNLKLIVTTPDLNVERKFLDSRAISNHANIAMLSNHNDALALEANDRRVFVMRAVEHRNFDYKKLGKWGLNGGAGAVLNFLMKQKITDYSPVEDAPTNEFKREIITHGGDDNSTLLELMLADPTLMFSNTDGKFVGPELRTAIDIASALNTYAENNGLKRMSFGPQSIGSALAHKNVLPKRKINMRVPGRSTPATLQLYSIVNHDEWKTKTNGEWALHYKKNDERFARDLRNVTELRKKPRKEG